MALQVMVSAIWVSEFDEINRDGPGREGMIANPYRFVSLPRISGAIPSDPYRPHLRRLVVMLGHHHVHP